MQSLQEALESISDELDLVIDSGGEHKELQNKVEEGILLGNAEVRSVDYSRDIFSQYISFEGAREIINIMEKSSKVSALNMSVFEKNLFEICISIVNRGESPVEMLIYSTKSINYNAFIEQAVLNVLKNLEQYDENFEKAYMNILKKWSWVTQLSITIKSIINLGLTNMASYLFYLAEANENLRIEAADAIVALEAEEYYGRVVDMFLAIQNDTNDFINSVKSVFNNMSKSERGKKILFTAYFENGNIRYRNILLNVIRNKLNNKDMEKIISYKNGSDKGKKSRAMFLLSKSNCKGILEIFDPSDVKSESDMVNMIISIGYKKDKKSIPFLKEQIEKGASDKIKSAAIISLGNQNDENEVEYLKEVLMKSEESKNAILKIASSAALIQLGDIKLVKNIFEYLVKSDGMDEEVEFAKRQLHRLKGDYRLTSVHKYINTFLIKLLEKIEDKDENMILNILYVLDKNPNDEIYKMMFNELKNSKYNSVKSFVIKHLTENYKFLNEDLKKEFKNILVLRSNSSDNKENREIMSALKILNRRKELAPNLMV